MKCVFDKYNANDIAKNKKWDCSKTKQSFPAMENGIKSEQQQQTQNLKPENGSGQKAIETNSKTITYFVPFEKRNYSDPNVCDDLKKRHDACFYHWYKEKFLPGVATKLECEDEWSDYQQCLKVILLIVNFSPLKRFIQTEKTKNSWNFGST